MANPWSKFFWSDWESDPALKLCSFAAQGLWMRMLCIAAAHDPIGYVAVNGRALDAPALARMTGGTEPEVAALLDELSSHGVFSVDRHGRIYSRRMVKDAKLSQKRSKAGAVGADVTNGKRTGKNSLLRQNHGKASANGSAKVRPQKPEARVQNIPNLPPGDYGEACSRVAEAGGMLGIPPDHQLLREWLDLPNVELDRDIIPVVRRVAANVRERGGRTPFKFKLFDAEIRRAAAEDAEEIARLERTAKRLRDECPAVAAGGAR